MSIKHTVDSVDLNKMTVDKLQEFIDECRGIGMPGTERVFLVGKSEGYNFTGTYRFTPQAIRAGHSE